MAATEVQMLLAEPHDHRLDVSRRGAELLMETRACMCGSMC
jgi:hypothetical protein